MRLPVSLLIWLKLIFSRSLVAGNSWMGQDTRERRRKPFQYARGAMGRSYTTPAEQVIRTMYLLRAYITPLPRRMCSQSVPETKKRAASIQAASRNPASRRSLLELRRNGVEPHIEARADRIHTSNDDNRNACGDQAVLDSGSA